MSGTQTTTDILLEVGTFKCTNYLVDTNMTHALSARRRRSSSSLLPEAPVDHRAAGPAEAADESQPEALPRFEVCINGRCPIEETLNVIAGRWKILILWWLQAGELRFGELRRRVPTVTPKMLTQHLRQMESEGLVRREVFAQVPPKVT